MKTIIAIIAAAVLSISAQAQTNVITPQTFFQTTESYLTSFNTNYTFVGNAIEVSTGYKQVTGVNAASVLDAQYDIARFNIGGSMQFSGVGSPVNALEIGGGYALIEHYDVKLDADLLGGYDWVKKAMVVEPELSISKKMTPNTFTRLAISMPVYSKGSFNRSPSFRVEVGFTY